MTGAWFIPDEYGDFGYDGPEPYVPDEGDFRFVAALADEWADAESFELHYGDEIDGNAIPESDDVPPLPRLTNAPGQLRFPFGAALR